MTREALTTWEAREQARMGRSQGDSWEDRGTSERCLVRHGLPAEVGMVGYGQFPTNEVVQSPGYVSIVMPTGYVRIIPTDGRSHAGAAIRQWYGDSVGRWDGNTLVVETTNFKNQVKNVVPGHGGPFGGSAHVHYYPGSGEKMRLTERFTPSGDTLEYRFTLDDPEVFVQPWTAVVEWRRDKTQQERIFEYACHEHNYGMANALAGSQADRAWALGEAARDAATRKKEIAAKWEQLKQWEASHGKR